MESDKSSILEQIRKSKELVKVHTENGEHAKAGHYRKEVELLENKLKKLKSKPKKPKAKVNLIKKLTSKFVKSKPKK